MEPETRQFSQVHYTHPPLDLKGLFDAIGYPSTFVEKDAKHYNPHEFQKDWEIQLIGDVTFPQNQFELFWETEDGDMSIHMAPATLEVVRKIHPYVFRNFFAVHGHRFGYFDVAILANDVRVKNDRLCFGGYFRSELDGYECTYRFDEYPSKCSKELQCDHLCKFHSAEEKECYCCPYFDKEIYEFDETNKLPRVKKRMRSDD